MKKFILAILISLGILPVMAQPKDPVTWTYESRKKSEGVYEIIITAKVTQPWHIYSQNTGKGPIPTKFVFKPNPLAILDGKVKETGKLEKVHDPNFNSDVLYFSDVVKFIQVVKLRANAKTSLSGNVEYMDCNDEQCLPPVTKSFNITLQ